MLDYDTHFALKPHVFGTLDLTSRGHGFSDAVN
jgi:hypothetical protein